MSAYGFLRTVALGVACAGGALLLTLPVGAVVLLGAAGLAVGSRTYRDE
jgi:hypothetical protein